MHGLTLTYNRTSRQLLGGGMLLKFLRPLTFLFALCAGVPEPLAETHRPVVLLVSIDGFRWDYIDKTPAPNLHRFAAGSVRAKALIPVFPSETLPSHCSMATGLYPEHHGIVGNKMHDPIIPRDFNFTDGASTLDSRWWRDVGDRFGLPSHTFCRSSPLPTTVIFLWFGRCWRRESVIP